MAQAVDVSLPAVVAGTPLTQVLGVDPSFVEETAPAKIQVTSPSAVAANATNYCTIAVRQLRAGAVVTTIGSLALSTTSLVAEVPVNVPIAAGADFANLQSGDELDVYVTHTGTGLALPAGVNVQVELA